VSLALTRRSLAESIPDVPVLALSCSSSRGAAIWRVYRFADSSEDALAGGFAASISRLLLFANAVADGRP
jgi:hypothetical protein